MSTSPGPNGVGDVRTRELSRGTFAYLQGDGGWCLSNSGIILGNNGALVVDTAATEKRSVAQHRWAMTHADERSVWLVNTHAHGDHSFGNSHYGLDVPIIGGCNSGRSIRDTGRAVMELWPDVLWGKVNLREPNLEVSDSITLDLGNRIVQIFHPGPAHTSHDLVVWDPRSRVLFAGDIVWSKCVPFVLFGSVVGSLKVLSDLSALKSLIVVPGHGSPGSAELLQSNIRYFEWVLQVSTKGIEAGHNPEEVAGESVVPHEFRDWVDKERTVANIYRAYADLDGEPPCSALDFSSIWEQVKQVSVPVSRA